MVKLVGLVGSSFSLACLRKLTVSYLMSVELSEKEMCSTPPEIYQLSPVTPRKTSCGDADESVILCAALQQV